MPRYIDADALRKEFSERPPDYYSTGYILDTIDEQPALSPDDVRGVGKLTQHVLKNANTPWGYDCSACGEWFVIGDDTAERYNYCPNCGAKMEVTSDAE